MFEEGYRFKNGSDPGCLSSTYLGVASTSCIVLVDGCKVAESCAALIVSVLQGHCCCVRNSYPKIPVFVQYKYDRVKLVHTLGEGNSRDKR